MSAANKRRTVLLATNRRNKAKFLAALAEHVEDIQGLHDPCSYLARLQQASYDIICKMMREEMKDEMS